MERHDRVTGITKFENVWIKAKPHVFKNRKNPKQTPLFWNRKPVPPSHKLPDKLPQTADKLQYIDHGLFCF